MTDDIKIPTEKLFELLDAAMTVDYAKVRRLGGEFANICLDQGQELAAKRLRAFLRRRGVPLQASGVHQSLPVDTASRMPLIDEEQWPSTAVVLNREVESTISRFLHDVQNAQLLSEGGLLTRFGLMLSGPPGTGKTLLAGHVAAQLKRPFYVARLDSLISARLGDTAKNIRQIFEFASAKGGILFLDELDAVAKMRDDRHELGELKRVVNTVIQGLDSLDDRSIVIAATNHPQLLDAAIWRRFPYRCEVNLPDVETRTALWMQFLYSLDATKQQNAEILAQLSAGLSGADIENLALAARRLSVLNKVELPEPSLLYALVKSTPENIRFPELDILNIDQRREVISALSHIPTINKTHFASMLGVSRMTVHRHLEGEHDE